MRWGVGIMNTNDNLNDIYIRSFLRGVFEGGDGNKRKTILDVGCGKQPYADIYQKHYGRNICIDINRDNIAVDVIASAEVIPLHSETIDVILCTEVVEHVADPLKAISEMARLLRPDGMLLLTWPLHYSLHEMPYDFSRITEYGMAHLCQSCGLRIENILRRGTIFAVIHTLCSHLTLNMIEYIKRMPIIGVLFRPLGSLAKALFHFSFMVHAKASMTFLGDAKKEDEDMSGGVLRALHLWTLGYCCQIRKM